MELWDGTMAHVLTAIQLVSDDNEEGNTSPKGVDSDGYFTEDSCDLPTCGSNNLLIGVFIGDLERADGSSQTGRAPVVLQQAFSFCWKHVMNM